MAKFKSTSLKKVLQYAKPYQSKLYWVVISLIALSVLAAIRPYMIEVVVDKYISKHNSSGLVLFIMLMGAVLIFEIIAQYAFTYVSSWLGQNIVKDIRQELFHKMLRFRLKYFDNEPVGKLITRNVSDIESIASIFSQGLFMIVGDVLKMFVVLLIMLYMNWKLSLVVILAMPILFFAIRIFQKHMKTAFEEVRYQIANMNTFIQERVTGMKIVQLFNREDIEYKKFEIINKKHNDAWQKNILYNSIFFPIADIISQLTLGFVILYGGFSIIDGGNFTTVGTLIAYTTMIPLLFNPLRQIADKFNVMQMGIIAADRVFEVMNETDLIQEEGNEIAPNFKGKIDMKDVHFSYIKGTEVLKGINLSVDAGKTIAIVGGSGAGKSTIINLLSRFYEIDKGEITIDNLNINNFTLESLRSQIAVVLQDVFLFSDTIYNNITLNNPNITEEEVYAAAKKIGVHQFIESLPNGYQYNVKERGAMISSGQRQLIAFLRAYVSNPSILILDEATSSIDTYSEELIQSAIGTLTTGRTSIVIAHRLATIVNADHIIVMDQGKIVEQGTHNSLLEVTDGYYKGLYESQYAVNS